MNSNIFFKKKNIKIKELFPKNNFKRNFVVNDIKPLHVAGKNDITFFDSIKYKDSAKQTKAGICITIKKLIPFI